jgi:hypothetical protein
MAWISPVSTLRSMESLARRAPKDLEIPRSSSDTGGPILEAVFDKKTERVINNSLGFSTN